MALATPDRDRWLALVLLLAAIALAYLVLVHPVWTAPMLEVNRELADSRERELRVRTQLQQAPLIQQRLAETGAQLARHPGFLPESSPQLATAGLVKRLETVVQMASPNNRSCAISNRSPMPPPGTNDRFSAVVVQVRMRCGTPELAAVLHALETGSPRLFVDNLNLLTMNYAFQAMGGTGNNNGLDVSFDLYGYLRPGVAPAAVTAPASDALGSDAY